MIPIHVVLGTRTLCGLSRNDPKIRVYGWSHRNTKAVSCDACKLVLTVAEANSINMGNRNSKQATRAFWNEVKRVLR